jgi:hypothetical protein
MGGLQGLAQGTSNTEVHTIVFEFTAPRAAMIALGRGLTRKTHHTHSFAKSLRSFVPGGSILVIRFLKISLRVSHSDSSKKISDLAICLLWEVKWGSQNATPTRQPSSLSNYFLVATMAVWGVGSRG